MHRRIPLLLLVASLSAGCGGPKPTSAPTATTTSAAPGMTTTTDATTSTASGPSALQAEANSAAAGDIPDNQVFLVFRNANAGYSMKYPEGWARQGSGDNIVLRDKNNIVRVFVAAGAAPTKASLTAELSHLKNAHREGPPQAVTISGRPAFKLVYTTVSRPSAVTGKRVRLVVDRYYLWRGKRRAIVDLATPVGVDNVDAYRMMIESFRWS